MTGSSRGPTLVVGGGGFIGSHLVSALPRAARLIARGVVGLPAATVFFVAGRVTPSRAPQHPDQVAAELASFRQLLRNVARRAQPPRVVLASSGGTIYAPTDRPPCREGDPVGPNNAYGVMKLEMERMLLTHPGVEPVVVRLANIYGPGQQPRRGLGVVAHWLDAVRRSQPIVLHGHPDSTRDYLYVDDAIDLLLRINEADRVPPVLNAGSGASTSLARLAGLVREITGRPDAPVVCSGSRTVDRMHVRLDIARAQAALKWVPRVPIREGLARTWRHVTTCPAAVGVGPRSSALSVPRAHRPTDREPQVRHSLGF